MKIYPYILINKGNMKAPVEHFATTDALMTHLFPKSIDKIKKNFVIMKDEKIVIPLDNFNVGGDYMSQFRAMTTFIENH